MAAPAKRDATLRGFLDSYESAHLVVVSGSALAMRSLGVTGWES